MRVGVRTVEPFGIESRVDRGPVDVRRATGPPGPAFADSMATPARSGAATGGEAIGLRPPASSRAGAAAGLMEDALRDERRIDVIVRAAASGHTFRSGELLALQATVFRYCQTVEVTSRLADRVVGAVRQTLGTPL